jgi:CBS domain-containing protein
MKVASDFLVEIPLLKDDDLITRARQLLRDDVFRELYVHDGKKKLLGLIDITDVLRVMATKSNVTVEGYISPASAVQPPDTIEAVVRSIRASKRDSAPVVDPQQQLLGGVLLSDLFPIIITRHDLKGCVSDYMTRHPVTCSVDDTILRIYSLIVESGFTSFPVLKKKKLAGIISRRDFLREGRLRPALENAATKPVEVMMTRQVITVGPEHPVDTAAKMMAANDISILPVIDDGVLAGVLDRHDVLKGLK